MRTQPPILGLLIAVGLLSVGSLADADPKLYEGRTLDDWIGDLRLFSDATPASRERAIASIGRIGKPAVAPLLRKVSKLHALGCARALARIGEPAIPALIQALTEGDDLMRIQRAAEALGEMGPAAKASVWALGRTTQHDDMWIRIASLDALGQIGPGALGVAPAIRSCLYDPWVRVPISAAEALWRVTGEIKLPVDTLLRSLRDVDESIRDTALQALGRIGPTPRVIRILIRTLNDVAEPPRRTARQVLAEYGDVALPALLEALGGRGRTQATRAGAALVVAKLGSKAAPAVPALQDLFDRRQPPPVRDAAAYALGEIGAAAAPAVPALIAGLSDPERVARTAALQALGRIGDVAAVDPIAALLESDETPVRVLAAEALGRFGPGAAPAVPALVRALGDLSPAVRRWSAEALGRVGAKARTTSALKALTKLLDDRERPVADAARAALDRVR